MEYETQITSSGYSLIKMFYNMLCEYLTLSWDLKENIGDCFIDRGGQCYPRGRRIILAVQLSLPESSWEGRVRSCLMVICWLRTVGWAHQY